MRALREQVRRRLPLLNVLGRYGFAALVAALVTFKLLAQLAAGADWDTYSFVANAAEWAGRGYGYTEPSRPPLISLIASLPMRMGLEGPAVVQCVDAALALASLGAFYLLFRRRFGPALSAVGVLALLASPPVWQWLAVGYTDLAAFGLCAIALEFALRAADDPRWYAASFPTFLAAGLMRHTALLFGFALAVAVLLRVRPFRHMRGLIAGLIATAIALLPFALYYQRLVGHPLYPFVASAAIKQGMGSSGDAHVEIASYLTGLPTLVAAGQLAPIAFVVLALALVGMIGAAGASLRSRRVPLLRCFGAGVTLWAAFVLVTGAGLGMSATTIAVATFVVWRLLASDERPAEGGWVRHVDMERALDAAMLVWLIVYWQFHENWAQHFLRYYIAMAPGVVYFSLLGLRSTVAFLRARAKREGTGLSTRFASFTAAPALTLAVLAALVYNVSATSTDLNPVIAEARSTAAWLASQPDVGDARIYSDVWPITAYYLQRRVDPMPFYPSGQAVEHELEVSAAEYYVTLKGYRPRNYVAAQWTGDSVVLARKEDAEKTERLPEILYLGVGWENYLEDLTDYRVVLVHNEGDYNMEGSAYFDAYTLEELRRYDVVAAFGGRWRSRPGFEDVLGEYVLGGGTLVMDMSANMTRPFDLNRSALLGAVIDRRRVDLDAPIVVSPTLAARHPEAAVVDAAPWLAEDGSPWYGATYSPLPGNPFRVLATVGGQPLVAEQHLGRGRVIWVGANLLWHAHRSGSPSERRLVRAVIDEATGRSAGVASIESVEPAP